MSFLSGRPRYAARLNAFRADGGHGLADLLARAAEVGGLDAADLNYPDHFAGSGPGPQAAKSLLDRHGLALNGLAMRYYTDPAFRLGAFTNPDPKVRRAAIDLTKRGLDTLAEMGGGSMVLWLGQDGVDYSFQGDFDRMWADRDGS